MPTAVAVGSDGTVVARYPATVGSEHDPLPVGEWKINGVGWNPVEYEALGESFHLRHRDHLAARAAQHDPMRVVDHHPLRRAGHLHQDDTMTTLFDPITIGDVTLKNRVVMAPLTRNRSPGAIPNNLNATYYEQRATAGLIVSAGTPVSQQGQGYADVPGLYLYTYVTRVRGSCVCSFFF